MEQHTNVALGTQQSLGFPFRWSQRAQSELPVTVSGNLPAWLKGQLVRTAPAEFARGSFTAEHLFDAHGLLYGFEIGQGVHFKQQLLASRHLAAVDRGENRIGSFGTSMKRSFLQRLVEPAPKVTDNANVNVVPWQGQWLAMTESPHQHVIDPGTLGTRGLYEYQDDLPADLFMSAHPHYEAESGALVNVGTRLGAKSELVLYRQHKGGKRREVLGALPFKRMPYVHAFGLTHRHAVIIDHPLRVNPLRLLFSNKGFIRHFEWQPERTTRLWKFERESGKFTAYETEPLFCFHILNTFEDGADVVFDFLAFDDPRVIDDLNVAQLTHGLPTINPRPVRARLRPGKREVALETLSDARFEFPQIAYRSHHGKPYRYAWGTEFATGTPGEPEMVVHKLDVSTGDFLSYREREFAYGEPVFVPRPGAAGEDDGVLLTVGSHRTEERTRLAVLDAQNLELLASCEAELSLPLGFHGSFSSSTTV